ncbi:MAG: diiron oxygenase [Planctomycetaceae bacterium]|nr:diiron oxygenase [Planctomycetaceae bacterium]
MAAYTYADCLKTSYAVNWRIEDVLGDRAFDPSLPWLPAALSATGRLPDLDADDRRRLTQVELAAYAHLFGYVEEFIAPQMVALAGESALAGGDAFDALTNFAAEEVKHMTLFREVRRRVDAALGFATALVGGKEETARFVLSKDRGAVLLLTAALEWMSQRHFREAIRDDGSLDPLTRDVFRAHWLEESQHARMDHLETVRAFAGMDAARRDRAVEDLAALLAGVDGLLQAQAGMDVENFERLRGAALPPGRREAVHREVLRAKRWAFVGSGVTHPRFEELYLQVTTESQRARVGGVLAEILGEAAAAA